MSITNIQSNFTFLQVTQKRNESKVENDCKAIEQNTKIDTVSLTTYNSSEYDSYFNALTGIAERILTSSEILGASRIGALATIGNNVTSKTFKINSGIKGMVNTYCTEIALILANPNMSDSEKDSKINTIKEKIKKLFEEGQEKLEKIFCFLQTVKSLRSYIQKLKMANVDTTAITETLAQMAQNINTSPTDLSNCQNSDEMDNEIDKNKNSLFDASNTNLIGQNLKKAEEKINEIKEKLLNDNLTTKEKSNAKQELTAYETLKKLLEQYKQN